MQGIGDAPKQRERRKKELKEYVPCSPGRSLPPGILKNIDPI